MAQSYDATDLPFAPPSRSSLISARNSSIQYLPPSYPPPSFHQANTETYIVPHHYSQNGPISSLPQQPAYYNAHATPVPTQATSYNIYPHPTLSTTVRNDSDHRMESATIPSVPTQPAPAVYHDPCVVATPSQASLNDHSRGIQFLDVSAQPQSHSLNPSNNVNFANRAHPLIYDHSSLSRSQTFSDDLPFRPRMHASTPQMQVAPTPPFKDKLIPLISDGHRSRSTSVETPLYPTPPPAYQYQEVIYTPTPPIPIPQPPQSSSSTSSPHSIAQPLYQEQVALSLRQQQLRNGRPASAVHAPSPLHHSCSADLETGPSTTKKPVKGRSRKTQPPKSPKRRAVRTRAKKAAASMTAVDASINTARGVSSRDVDMVANSSTATQSGQHSPSAAWVGSSTATASTNKRRGGYLDGTSGSNTATKRREDTGYLIRTPSYIAGRWLSPEAEEKLYSSSPSYSRPLDRFACDVPLFNILKPERGRTITLGYKIETLGLIHAVSLSSCLNGNSLLDSPHELIGKPDLPPVLTINVVWFGYMNINYMLQVSLNQGGRALTKAHLAAIIAHAYKDIIKEHSEEECKQPSQCPVPMLKLGKGGVAFEQIKVTDIQQDEDGIWHPTIYLGCPLDVIRGCLGSEQDISNLDKYYHSISI